MAIYHNDFDKKKDPMMWRLHEIRHKMQKEKLSSEQINAEGRKVLQEWVKKHKKKELNKVN
ncbi:MAG: hypothetical protein ACMUJM_10840 [bacterium]